MNNEETHLHQGLHQSNAEEISEDVRTWGINIPRHLHPETQRLVIFFAEAMAKKLSAAERKYGYSDGWRSPDWMDECRKKLVEHLAKGDPRDVANYCAFLWHHKEPTAIDAVLCDFTVTKSPNVSESVACSCEQMMRRLRNAEQQRDELLAALKTSEAAAFSVLIAGGDYGDDLSDYGLRKKLKDARDAALSAIAKVKP